MVSVAIFLRDNDPAHAAVLPAVDDAIRASRVAVERAVLELDDAGTALRLQAYHAPRLTILNDAGDARIHFQGTLLGRGVEALAVALRLTAGAEPALPAGTRMRLRELAAREKLRLIVPFDHPRALDLVRAAVRVALASPLVDLEVIETPGELQLIAGLDVLELPADGVALARSLLRARCWHPESAPL